MDGDLQPGFAAGGKRLPPGGADDSAVHPQLSQFQIYCFTGRIAVFYQQFTVAEIPGKFFNGSNPVSSVLIMCREADVLDELPEVAWRFKKGVSKQWGSEYIAMSAI